ncbi:MAG: S-layer homology domain-containing protein [Vulcanimicrobiota bacterium]
MKRHVLSLVASVLLFAMALPAMSAPLFPDVPDNHWAKDAVAALAAKGLVEGYPDGTFKGDRAATRWEVAMIVARLLAKMEQAHATFATKAELEELRKLVNALREELDALGVRVTNLEEKVSRIDKRVTELERITFYGEVEAVAVFQSFSNGGRFDNDGLRNGGGNVAVPGPGPIGTTGFLNYNTLVGSGGGAALNPAVNGVLPVIDFRNGRPLTNGTGFTMNAVLGLRIRVSEDIDAGAEFSAYSSQGDAVVDAFWGAQAPFLSNPFTGASFATGQNLTNAPFTRMNLDNFWVVHNPSQTKLVLGAFGEDMLDDVIYAGQYNPSAFGSRYNDSYGFDLSGHVDLEDWGVFHWEVLGTRLGDAATGANFIGYENFLLGADAALEFEGGYVKVNFARVAQESAAGAPLTVGGVGGGGFFPVNVDYAGSTGFTPLQWVNPPGFFAAQTSQFNQINGGFGSTVDQRPIPGWNTVADNSIGGAGGGLGPQSMNSYGISGEYKWDIADGDQVYINADWAHSVYKPNRNSSYDVDGDAVRFGVGANLFDGDLDIAAEYLTVDATYDPFILSYGGLGVVRLPNIHYFTNLYSLHDTEKYPHNREGFRLKGTWRFAERRGAVWAKLGFLDQKETSLYDVRVLTNGLGNGAPTNVVIGMSPGFIDPVFAGYAHPAIYGAGSGNSFTNSLQPLENPSGSHDQYGLGVTYKFDDPRVKLDLGFERNEYLRRTSLAPGFGGSQNHIDLNVQNIHGEVAWEASDQWTLRGGADVVTIDGHYDPAGVYNNFAISTGSSTFTNIDSDQFIPFIGFDYDVSENTTWNMDFRYYSTDSGSNVPTTLTNDAIGRTQNPFEWNGWQVSTQFRVKF